MNQAKSGSFCLMQIKDIGGFTLNKKSVHNRHMKLQ